MHPPGLLQPFLSTSLIGWPFRTHVNIPAMSCPYFYPQALAPDRDVPLPARMPLGLLFQGECHADSDQKRLTADDHCNFGYARGSCSHFPNGADADAVRFSVSSSRE